MHAQMDEATKKTQKDIENTEKTNFVSKDQSGHINQDTKGFSQKDEKLMKKTHFQTLWLLPLPPVFIHNYILQSKQRNLNGIDDSSSWS